MPEHTSAAGARRRRAWVRRGWPFARPGVTLGDGRGT
jgi:hypothetical protein